MKLNILLCDTFPGLLPSYIPSYELMFVTLFRKVNTNLSFEVFRAMDGILPEDLQQDEIYLITGCNLSAYDDIPWINALKDWIVRADRRRLKLTGICFGHQIIAEALGGKVEKASAGWGTGVRESVIVDDWGKEFFPDGRMRLMYNHHDQVVKLPPTATLVASGDFCPVESFRVGRHILTFQGHPEYIPQYNEHLIRNFADDEPAQVKERALESLKTMTHQGETVARWILSLL